MRNANNVSRIIYKRSGELELIQSTRPKPAEPPGIPTVAGLVPVTDIMSRDVICAHSSLLIDTVVDLLVNNYIGCVPIVDDDGRPIGIITKRDVVEPMAVREATDESLAYKPLAPRTAEDVMLPIVLTLDDRSTVAQAAALMATEDLHHVPIVSARGRLIGVVSSLDIVRWLARNDGVVASSRTS